MAETISRCSNAISGKVLKSSGPQGDESRARTPQSLEEAMLIQEKIRGPATLLKLSGASDDDLHALSLLACLQLRHRVEESPAFSSMRLALCAPRLGRGMRSLFTCWGVSWPLTRLLLLHSFHRESHCFTAAGGSV